MNPAVYDEIRERLVLRRQQLGLSQAALAEIIGIDTGTMSRMETGNYNPGGSRRYPGPKQMVRWARGLRMDAKIVVTLNAPEWPEPLEYDVTDVRQF